MFRILTVNLLNGDADPLDLERVIHDVQPDIVMAQELGPNSAAVLRRLFANGLIEPSANFDGKALVSNLPLTAQRVDFPQRFIVRGLFPQGGTNVEILNLHLANPIDGSGRVQERREQLHALKPWLEGHDPLIVAGDFNASPRWPVYKTIAASLTDAARQAAFEQGRKPANTWGWRPGSPAVLRIDHVFVRGLKATGSQVIKVRGSDHRALVVDLKMANRQPGSIG